MSKTVSNEALWEKLSEVDRKLERLSELQKSSNLSDKHPIIKSDFQKEKDEIVEKMEKYIQGLGTHCDDHFKMIYKNIEQSGDNTHDIYKLLARMWSEVEDSKAKTKHESYLNFKLFKVKKTSLVIAVLGLLVFILTLFCIKQQNDYALLNDEYHRHSIVIMEVQSEVDSLKNNTKIDLGVRKK